MNGTIPVMRVNYSILHLLRSLFVTESSTHYRDRLETMIRIFFSVNNVMLTSSARCAIYMILRSLPQRKVIVPSYTCEVVVEAVMLAGKEVVFAPVSKKSLNISEYPDIDRDSVVIATHQYGFMSDIEELVKMCREKGAVLVEDCAGSFGGRINGRLTGTFGDYAVFSFSASKTLHSPTKGGFIIARNKDLLDKIQPLTYKTGNKYSFKIKQFIKAVGFCLAKSRAFASWLYGVGRSNQDHSNTAYLNDLSYHFGMFEWQACVLLKQFDNMESLLMERRKLYKKYFYSINNKVISCKAVEWGGMHTFPDFGF